jgi:hypothetical protein
MGSKGLSNKQLVLRRWAEEELQEWDIRTGEAETYSDAELADFIALVVKELAPHRGDLLPHAYGPPELAGLAEHAGQPSVPLKQLHRWTDVFAVYFFSILIPEPQETAGRRYDELLKFANEVEQALGYLDHNEFGKELLASRILSGEDIQTFRRICNMVIARVPGPLEHIYTKISQGKSPQTDLQRHLVYMTALLCRRINIDFNPAGMYIERVGRLLGASRVLAAPFFAEDAQLVTATREYIKKRKDRLAELRDPDGQP